MIEDAIGRVRIRHHFRSGLSKDNPWSTHDLLQSWLQNVRDGPLTMG